MNNTLSFEQLVEPIRYQSAVFDPTFAARSFARLDGMSVIAINSWCRKMFGMNFHYIPPHTHARHINRPYRLASIWIFKNANDHMRFVMSWQGSALTRVTARQLESGIPLFKLTNSQSVSA